jgi:hypothetical protein
VQSLYQQAGEAFSLANQAAAAAAQLPLPPEDEAVAEAFAPNAEESPIFASVDTTTAAAAPSTAGGGEWGAALLKSNQAAASAATAAVQAAIDDAAAGEQYALTLVLLASWAELGASSLMACPQQAHVFLEVSPDISWQQHPARVHCRRQWILSSSVSVQVRSQAHRGRRRLRGTRGSSAGKWPVWLLSGTSTGATVAGLLFWRTILPGSSSTMPI